MSPCPKISSHFNSDTKLKESSQTIYRSNFFLTRFLSYGLAKMIPPHIVVYALLLSVIVCLIEASTFDREAFVIRLAGKEETCFSKTFTKTVKIIFEFSVTEGGNRDIDVRIVSPNGLVIYKESKRISDEVSFKAGNGDFKFCFSNAFSRFVSKRIAFNIRPFETASLSEQIGEHQATVKNAVESFCDDIFNLMTFVVDFQMKYRVHESMGRYLAEALNKRVLWWSVFQSILILLTGFGQVFIFKRFFTEKRVHVSNKQDEVQNPIIVS